MRVLVTGGTGLVGNAVTKKLLERGHEVTALVRDKERAARHLAGATLVAGDITDRASVLAAARGAEWVFHTAGLPEQWQPDEGIFDRVNRGGTANVLSAALEAGARRVVYTSTMDVFAAPPGGTLVEDRIDPEPKHTAYERSKQAAEVEAERIREKGLDVVYVNPSAVYGPAPVHVTLNVFFIKLLRRQAPVLPPGGMSICYVDGCAEAHVAAAERGKSGERYLLADRFVTNEELAAEIVRQAGLPRVPKTAPPWAMKGIARVATLVGRVLGREPLIAPSQVSFLLWAARVDATKAARELGFVPEPLEDGVAKTIAFLRAEGLVPAAS